MFCSSSQHNKYWALEPACRCLIFPSLCYREKGRPFSFEAKEMGDSCAQAIGSSKSCVSLLAELGSLSSG